MKMEALTTFMKDQPKVKKVYLMNQNYSHGQQVSKYFKEGIMARKRPDVQIVGDDLHPIGQVKDFAPMWPRSSSRAPTPSSPATGVRT
jgi:branched-chain amino acid transport system substrate-binding protein